MKRNMIFRISFLVFTFIVISCDGSGSSYLLRVTGGPDVGKSLAIDMKSEHTYTLGRYVNSDLVLSDRYVSRRHASVYCVPAGCTMTDVGTKGVGSTNGTFVNGVQLDANTPSPLHKGDVINLGGDTELVFDMAKTT